MSNWIASLFATALSSAAKSSAEGRSSVPSVVLAIIRTPLKAIGAFVFSPFLVLRVAGLATSKKRRWMASIGLFLAAILAVGAGTWAGKALGSFLVLNFFGAYAAVGYFFGMTFSVVFTLAVQVLILNSTCFLFLGLSFEEVVEHLKRVSE